MRILLLLLLTYLYSLAIYGRSQYYNINNMSGRIKALSLYKDILRAHDKFLPHEMKQLGDAYVKSEVSQ